MEKEVKTATKEEVMQVMAFHQAKEKYQKEIEEELMKPNLTPEQILSLKARQRLNKKMDFKSFKKIIEEKKTQENPIVMSNNIPIMDKEYYKEIVIDFLTTHKKTWSKEEIEEIADMRAEAFVKRMKKSTNPMMDKEVFYQQMLEF